MTPVLGQIVGVLLLLFLLGGSTFLVWNGLATGLHGSAAIRGHFKARLVVGIFGFGLAAWVLLGMLTHAH